MTELAGLLPKGLAHLRALLRQADHTLLPPTASWRLMLALQILADLRDPRSPLALYMRALPAPPGARIAAVCCGGPADTGLLLFRCFSTVLYVSEPNGKALATHCTEMQIDQRHAVAGP